MRNTILNRVINFVRNIDPKIWISVGLGVVPVFVLWLFSSILGSVFDFMNDLERDRNASQKVYAEGNAEVKRDCDLVKKILRQKSVTYTYSCDGVEYQFDEWL